MMQALEIDALAATEWRRAGTKFQLWLRIGGLTIVLSARDGEFVAMLQRRYANFVCEPGSPPGIWFDLRRIIPSRIPDDDDLQIRFQTGRWLMRRGDFRAEWNPASGRGAIWQTDTSLYAIDSVMRIVLSLVLARRDGFLLHSASAVRKGRAFLFSGVSGAGKTTIARHAPSDAILLSDEISLVRRTPGGYCAFGTPFAGELGIAGEQIEAPIQTLFFLRKGPFNRTSRIEPSGAAAMLLRDILFFADDSTLMESVFATACDFVARVGVLELTFKPDRDVWEAIA
jgi:hypothetical protein